MLNTSLEIELEMVERGSFINRYRVIAPITFILLHVPVELSSSSPSIGTEGNTEGAYREAEAYT